MQYGREWCPHTATAAEVYDRLSAEERRDQPWVVVATAHPAKFNEIVEPIIGRPVAVPDSLSDLLSLPRAPRGSAADACGVGRSTRMSSLRIEPQWIGIGAAALLLAALGFFGCAPISVVRGVNPCWRRLESVALAAAHQVLVPDGMGGFIHIDHLLLTPRGVLVLDTRRVAGLIFGGDQMSDWTVMGRGHRYTFDNPQPALYDRIAAVKAIVGDVPVEGRLLFSNVGKFTKGIPKWVVMLDGIEVEFPGGGAQQPGVRGARRPSGRLEPPGRATAAQPAFVHESVSANSASALRVVAAPTLPPSRRAARPRSPRYAEGSTVRCAVISGSGDKSRGNR